MVVGDRKKHGNYNYWMKRQTAETLSRDVFDWYLL
jgi:hypothetical protein